MTKLSPNFRNDDPDGLDPKVRKYLDSTYLAKLHNLDKKNPKLLVVFSGGNAVGKTTISRKIEEELGGLVIENDQVKRQLLEYTPSLSRTKLNQLTWRYTIDLYHRLMSLTLNGLVVRDGVIDWYFERILPIFQTSGYKLFVIGFDIDRDYAALLIHKRGDTPTVKEDRFYKLLDDHAVHIKRFREQYIPDVVLNKENLFDHDMVIAKLKQELTALQGNST